MELTIPMIKIDDQSVYNVKIETGTIIGTGTQRRVYNLKSHVEYVLKEELEDKKQHKNLVEWHIYEKHSDLHGWLARPIAKTKDHKYMLMEKGAPLKDKSRIPENIPPGFGDIEKPENWVELPSGSIVMCDYSHDIFVKNYTEGKSMFLRKKL